MSTRRDEFRIAKAAKVLREAKMYLEPCEPIHEIIDNDIDMAYAVQEVNTEWRLIQGAKIIGKKIGLTSPAVQEQLGVDQPDFGILFQDMYIKNEGEFSLSKDLQVKVEAEVAFLLEKDLDKEDLNLDDVKDAIHACLPCLEIVASRVKDWNITIADTIADNASASHFVMGKKSPLEMLDPETCIMKMMSGLDLVAHGRGKDCMGSPLNAVLWLAQTMVEKELPLKRGEIILSGALGPMYEPKAGERISAEISGLGEVGIRFLE